MPWKIHDPKFHAPDQWEDFLVVEDDDLGAWQVAEEWAEGQLHARAYSTRSAYPDGDIVLVKDPGGNAFRVALHTEWKPEFDADFLGPA